MNRVIHHQRFKTVLLAGPAQRASCSSAARRWPAATAYTSAWRLAVVMNFASYFFSDKIALATYSAQPVTETENPDVYRRVAPIVRRPGAAHGHADAEAVRSSRAVAQRLRHRPQPEARFGGFHRRHFAVDERPGNRRRGGARVGPRAAPRHPDQLGGGHDGRRHHRARPHGLCMCSAAARRRRRPRRRHRRASCS